MKLSEETFVIYGYGIFEIFLAWRLAQDAKKVRFFRPWMGPFPRWEEQYVGKGIPWIERCDSWPDIKTEGLEKKHIFCFFDVGDGDSQEEIRKAGGRVFGVDGRLEMDREYFKRTLKERGLPVPKYGTIIGTTALGELLRKEKDLWIKLDVENRGVMETRYHEKWATSEGWYYALVDDLGCSRAYTKFMWEKPVPGVEPGWDNFIAKGVPFKYGLKGMEAKGDGYVCTPVELAKLDAPLLKVYNAMLPIEKKSGASGAISSEVRIDEQKRPHYIDACRRMGNPPAASISRIYKNFPLIVRNIADGIETEPEWSSKYAAELTVDHADACEKSIPMELTDKDMERIKIRCSCKLDNIYYNIPFKLLGNTVVKATGLGETREEAEFDALESAEIFNKKCPGAFWDKNTFEELEEEIKKAKKYGIETF